MQEMIKLGFGILFLLLGIPIGIFLRKRTQDESKQGQKWFKLIIITSLIGGIVGLIIGNDVLFGNFLEVDNLFFADIFTGFTFSFEPFLFEPDYFLSIL